MTESSFSQNILPPDGRIRELAESSSSYCHMLYCNPSNLNPLRATAQTTQQHRPTVLSLAVRPGPSQPCTKAKLTKELIARDSPLLQSGRTGA